MARTSRTSRTCEALILPSAQSRDWQSPEINEEGKEVPPLLYQYDCTVSIYTATRDKGANFIGSGSRIAMSFSSKMVY